MAAGPTQTSRTTWPFASPAPRVTLTQGLRDAYDNAIATARTCYSPRIVTSGEVGADDRSRAVRDRIARETFEAGHHTILQHATFQFAVAGVSRQAVWSFLHAHPFYNSEQVSQRYVEVTPGSALVPTLAPAEDQLFRSALERTIATYHRLIALLTPVASKEYFRLFPARRKDKARWAPAIRKRAQEVARYVLPVATFTHLYHTVSGLTLYRYARLMRQLDAPREVGFLVGRMLEEARAAAPGFFENLPEPLATDATLEAQVLASVGLSTGGATARAFAREFDDSLENRRSKLVGWDQAAEANVAQAVRAVLGLPRAALADDAAIAAVLDPKLNPYLSDALALGAHSKLMRALVHPHYTFRKKLSHAADSQDQRHRTVPASRPILRAHWAGGEPDAIVPDLVVADPEARALFDRQMRDTFADVDRLLAAGVAAEDALYLLPNAFPIRLEESGDLLNLRHKWVTRLCYTAQEEIWRASKEEVEQIRAVHPRIGEFIGPPCQVRNRAGARPLCPEGPRYCGVPVWRLPLDRFARLI